MAESNLVPRGYVLTSCRSVQASISGQWKKVDGEMEEDEEEKIIEENRKQKINEGDNKKKIIMMMMK